MEELNKKVKKNKVENKLKVGILTLVVGIIAIVMISSVAATNNCGLYVASCKTSSCGFTIGQCKSGEYSGKQIGCDNGDSSIIKNSYVASADTYLHNKGYSETAWIASFGNSYRYDYTKRVDADGDCRWEAVRDDDDHYITSTDGPEPNPQPVPWPNNNADLWNPFGCEKNTIQAWHATC